MDKKKKKKKKKLPLNSMNKKQVYIIVNIIIYNYNPCWFVFVFYNILRKHIKPYRMKQDIRVAHFR